jgi:hypothetical protein
MRADFGEKYGFYVMSKLLVAWSQARSRNYG